MMLKTIILFILVSIGVSKGNEIFSSQKIILGVDADEGQFPYMVSLNYKIGRSHFCGGSILTRNWILTSATCCLTGADDYVYSSSIYLSKGGLDFNITRKIVHPNFDSQNYYHNDICLVQIKGDIPINSNAQLINLPSVNFTIPDWSPVVVSGWGYTTQDTPQKVPDRLQTVTYYFYRTILPCFQLSGVPIFQGHLCAMTEIKQGLCLGDSGGPLTYNGIQIGIASFIFLPCAETGLPEYYTQVSNYIPWIEQSLGVDSQYLKIAKALH